MILILVAKKEKCLYPLHCLNCNGEDPDCCCNDEQCKDC
jgi:hypothetical protein